MSRYVVILIVPIAVGSLIAVAVLLINGLRERRERRDIELREAGRLKQWKLRDALYQTGL